MRQVKLAIAALALAVLSNSAHAACTKMDKVTAAWLPIMQTTAYYVALEEKLFEKACIEIDFAKDAVAKPHYRCLGC